MDHRLQFGFSVVEKGKKSKNKQAKEDTEREQLCKHAEKIFKRFVDLTDVNNSKNDNEISSPISKFTIGATTWANISTNRKKLLQTLLTLGTNQQDITTMVDFFLYGLPQSGDNIIITQNTAIGDPHPNQLPPATPTIYNSLYTNTNQPIKLTSRVEPTTTDTEGLSCKNPRIVTYDTTNYDDEES